MTSIVWLRRDLRLHDHAALFRALASGEPVQPVFVFDTEVLARFTNQHDRRLTFLAHTLCAIDTELQKRGGKLLVFHGKASEVLPALASAWNAGIFAAEDFEESTRARDAVVASKAAITLVKDHLIFSPNDILKDDKTPYKVYTPYSKAWLAQISPSDYGEYKIDDAGRYASVSAPLELKNISLKDGADAVLSQIGYSPADISHWPVTHIQARLASFIKEKTEAYPVARDMLATHGTSRLSPYLRFGLVSVRECVRAAYEAAQAAGAPTIKLDANYSKNGANKWLSELIWREFYAMILAHYPESTKTEWNPAYRGVLEWSHNAQHLQAWKEGKTGFPVVDAAMRELLALGWMHNRARMIVASFLTKDLQIDWRLGEEHFAQHLMDYELASNVGGWQWAASTGTDAQPYFRIFNPYLQSKKFDPEGEYIRRFVPELSHMKGAAIHEPMPLERGHYPAPMVDHADAREKTLQLFKNARVAPAEF